MNITWFRNLLARIGHWGSKNAPHILMGMGTAGSITAVIFTAKAQPAANQRIFDAQIEKSNAEKPESNEIVPLTLKEKIKAAGPVYIPAIGMELFSLLCFWGAHGIDVKRQAILAGCLSTAEQALIEYQKKVVEMIGDKPEKEIRQAIAQDHVDQNPPVVMYMDNDTDAWCLIDNQYFRSSYLKIKDTQNDANHEMIQNMYLSKADLYWMLDPERKYLRPGPNDGQIGWSIDKILILDIDSVLGPDHKPVLMISYKDKDGLDYAPQAGFSMTY